MDEEKTKPGKIMAYSPLWRSEEWHSYLCVMVRMAKELYDQIESNKLRKEFRSVFLQLLRGRNDSVYNFSFDDMMKESKEFWINKFGKSSWYLFFDE